MDDSQSSYIDNINIISDNDDLSYLVMRELNKSNGSLKIIDKTITSVINQTILKARSSSNVEKWMNCNEGCSDMLLKMTNQEIISTAYMLRLFAASIIDVTKTNSLTFRYNGNSHLELTGVWRRDSELFNIIGGSDDVPKRLIMGLGPSASGKTFWVENIIKMFGETSQDFPPTFLSVDGGIAREQSHTYQKIVESLKKYHDVDGFKNLKSTSNLPFNKSIFNSDSIKNEILRYLYTQKLKFGSIPLSLYIPVTLSNCISVLCLKQIKKYVALTGDERWIAVNIWQCKRIADCPMEEGFKCKSTEESGKSREKVEGKKYSSNAYTISRKNGNATMMKGRGAIIEIHNSGGSFNDYSIANKSTLIEYPNTDGEFVLNESLVSKYGSRYFRNGLLKETKMIPNSTVQEQVSHAVNSPIVIIIHPNLREVSAKGRFFKGERCSPALSPENCIGHYHKHPDYSQKYAYFRKFKNYTYFNNHEYFMNDFTKTKLFDNGIHFERIDNRSDNKIQRFGLRDLFKDVTRNIGNRDNCVVATHQYRMKDLFELKTPPSKSRNTGIKYGFMNCTCIKIYFGKNKSVNISVVSTPDSLASYLDFEKYQYITTRGIRTGSGYVRTDHRDEDLSQYMKNIAPYFDELYGKTIYVLRHGASHHNHIDVKKYKREPKQINSPLNNDGIKEAMSLNKYFKKFDISAQNTLLLSSPLDRAIQTMILAILGKHHKNYHEIKGVFRKMRDHLIFGMNRGTRKINRENVERRTRSQRSRRHEGV